MCVYITDTVCVCMHKPDSDLMYMYVGTHKCRIPYVYLFPLVQCVSVCWNTVELVSKCAYEYVCMYLLLHDQPLPDCTGPRLSRTMGSTLSGMSHSSSSPFPLIWPFCALW